MNDLKTLPGVSSRRYDSDCTTTGTPPVKVDQDTNILLDRGASALGISKKQLVAEAVREYLDARREVLRASMQETMAMLDGSTASRVALLSGLSREELDDLGGLRSNP
jgi:predicted transcriptional regulator